MERRWSLLTVAVSVGALHLSTAQAATISVAGQVTGNEARRWDDNTVTKTLDTNSNNLYAEDGFVMFGAGQQTSTFTDFYGDPLTFSNPGNGVATAVNPPSGVTIAGGWGGPDRVFGGQFYPVVGVPGTDLRLGFAGRFNVPSTWNDVTVGSTTYKAGQLFTLTIGATTPGAGQPGSSMRVGIYFYTDGNVAGHPPHLRLLTTGSDSGFVPLNAGPWTHTLHFFDIQNYQSGDVIELWTTAAGVGGQSYISGMTFDVVPIPEPGSIALMLGGVLYLVRSRRADHR